MMQFHNNLVGYLYHVLIYHSYPLGILYVALHLRFGELSIKPTIAIPSHQGIDFYHFGFYSLPLNSCNEDLDSVCVFCFYNM